MPATKVVKRIPTPSEARKIILEALGHKRDRGMSIDMICSYVKEKYPILETEWPYTFRNETIHMEVYKQGIEKKGRHNYVLSSTE